MSDTPPPLVLEILSGPLDGESILLTESAAWTNAPGSPLSFPWDTELGAPQAHLVCASEGWRLEAHPSPHGTYILSEGDAQRLTEGEFPLQPGLLLKASSTWLKVIKI